MSKKILDPEWAEQRRLGEAMKFAQLLEDGYTFPTEVEIEGIGTLVPGRLFQIAKPNWEGGHNRELGWYRFDEAVKMPEWKVGQDDGYWGTLGEYGITCHGPYSKNGTPKGDCNTRHFSVGKGASGRLDTRIWKIAKGRKTANSKGITLVKPAENGRAEKYADFEGWSNEHEGEQFSTQELAEKSGFSQQTVLKYLKTSAHFTKVKSGWYECGQAQTV